MAPDPTGDGPAFRRGRLLVASPTLMDENFTRTVVLMLEHSPEGALGLVLNRPTEIVARDVLPSPLADALPELELVHEGGPVQPEAVIVLADFSDPGAAASITVGSVGVVDPNDDALDLHDRVRAVRAFGGYAGWGAGQLEREITEGAWIDVEADAGDVFTAEPDALWRRVLDRKGGAFRLFARMPEDPSLN